MKIRHEVCIDNKGDSAKCCDEILTALGHGPAFKLKADTPDDTVHGAVTITHCDPRSLGEDEIQFKDGRREIASKDNIGAWFEEQGHKLVKIVGNTAFGNTIIDLKITDTDEAPTKFRKTTFKRPTMMPSAQECCDKIDAYIMEAKLAV